MPTYPSSASPVAVPISERIVANVLETLAGVSTAAGYQITLDVRRVEQIPPAVVDGLCLVGAGQALPQPEPPCLHDEFLMPIGVCVYAIEQEESGITLDQRLLVIAADVRRALKKDLHRGGYAVNTEFDKDELHPQPPASVIVWPRVRFRTLYNDPYHQ